VKTDTDIILRHQHPSGAYPACPTYLQYPYCWFRDGSFIAFAMDVAGEHHSAAAFHTWAARTLTRHGEHIRAIIARANDAGTVDMHEFLPARFTVDGAWQEDGWPNFQLDGYGQWLWSVSEHLRLTGRTKVPDAWQEGVDLACDYLTAFWQEPCYDAWEEYRSQLHTATLASICGGLEAISSFKPALTDTAAAIRAMILEECVAEGRFVKHIANTAVDASLLWVSTPFAIVPEADARMQCTVAEIERTLLTHGGLKRYAADTFYGGGAWVLLTAWLGWYHTRAGQPEKAHRCLEWLEQQRDANGHLPEQVRTPATNDRFHSFWTTRWGASAKPLLWSHAMAIVLKASVLKASLC
jgi:GH15 family glucan-1,4-alpha-glucosidase